MGFTKTYAQDNGVEITYWEITRVTFDFPSSTAEVSFDGWINEEARQEGKDKAGSFSVTVPDSVLAGEAVAPLEQYIQDHSDLWP